ncbi:MAG: hypothetical protein JWM11_7930 [Planctomycetaceae bacterium]|nr:hypothetical protein [Planctomycetaceae bacterium]
MPLNFALLVQFLLQERALKILEMQVDPKKLRIDIKAGTDGFWGWLLRAMGVDTKSGYAVDVTGCRRTGNGPVNLSRTFAPLYNLSSAVYFLVKPIGSLIAGAFFSLATLGWLFAALTQRQGPDFISLAFIGIFGTIAFACMWKFFVGDRTAVLGVITNAGTIVSIKLKVKTTDFRDLQQAIAIIETVVSRANGGSIATGGIAGSNSASHSQKNEELDDLEDAEDELEEMEEADDEPAPVVQRRQEAEAKRVIQCPHCDAKLRLNTSILGNRIRCPACQEPFVAK